ncbi:hypothetical protein ACIBCM_20810 [Streptomyces sp. NPDC051018]|uniref:hypothetical protein n=1 Tax=Streptomyces sp. NPDC051018 TaxID=3365639 RepID=UPI00379621DD
MNVALVESPVQLLNVLEWAHTRWGGRAAPSVRVPARCGGGRAAAPAGEEAFDRAGQAAFDPARKAGSRSVGPPGDGGSGRVPPSRQGVPDRAGGLTVVVLPPTDVPTRGQLSRMADLARAEGVTVHWQEARGGAGGPLKTVRRLVPLLHRAGRLVVGDPFSRMVQLLLTFVRAGTELTVVDDGTATMEFVAQLTRGERLERWHRRGGRRGPREMVLAPVSLLGRRSLTPSTARGVEIFTAMPVEPQPGITVTANGFDWTRTRFGPPRLIPGAELIGTSLVETGVVDPDHYVEAVRGLARTHGAVRYFAHRRESRGKLDRIAAETGLAVVRPELPLELVARRGPIGATVLSFPSTVVHTLPLALAGSGVTVAVCDIAPEWLSDGASPRARGFLEGVTDSASGAERLPGAEGGR